MAGVPFTDHPFVATIPAERETWDAERTRLAGASDPEAWRGTAKTWEGLGCPHRAGYAWWRQAQAQLDAGQPAAAAATALRAVVAAADGHTPLLAQVRALAERVRIPLQPPAATPRAPLAATPPPYGLTGRELAVLRLLARAHQCADRCRAVHQPENRRCARQQYPAQAESLRPGASRRGGRTGRPARSRLPLSTPRGNLNTRGPRSWVITRSAPPGLSSILGTRLSYAAEEAAMYPAPIQYLAQARLAAGQTNVPRALLSVDPMGTCPAALAGLVIEPAVRSGQLPGSRAPARQPRCAPNSHRAPDAERKSCDEPVARGSGAKCQDDTRGAVGARLGRHPLPRVGAVERRGLPAGRRHLATRAGRCAVAAVLPPCLPALPDLDREDSRGRGTTRLAYTVIAGIPVRNYRAEVTLTPTADGTHVRWAATWDATLAGRIVLRGLRSVYPQIVADLVVAAERQDAASLG